MFDLDHGQQTFPVKDQIINIVKILNFAWSLLHICLCFKTHTHTHTHLKYVFSASFTLFSYLVIMVERWALNNDL